MTRKLGTGLCALLLALSAAACGDNGGGAGGVGGGSINALAAAADNATEAGSSGMRMEMTMDVQGQEIALEGEGEFDFEEQVGEMTMTVSGSALGGQEQSLDMILDGEYVYMKMPPELGGPGWQRMATEDIAGAGASQFNQDPSQYLEFLRGASEGEIEEVGTEEIDGVSTTHYKADLSFDKMLDQAPDQEAADEIRAQFEAMGGDIDTIPSEVWIDEDGLPRRMQLSMSIEAEGQTAELDMTIDLFDYGVDVEVEPPADYEDVQAPPG